MLQTTDKAGKELKAIASGDFSRITQKDIYGIFFRVTYTKMQKNFKITKLDCIQEKRGA